MKTKTIAIIVMAALAATAIAQTGIKCVSCKGTGWNGNLKCGACGGDGEY